MDNTAFFKLSYGLFVVTAHEGDKDNGCITNTVVQQTITPNRISVTINKNNYTHDMIKRTGVFNVSVLSEKAKFETFKHWGFQSGKDVDKTVGITYFRLENGVIYIVDGVNAVMCAKVEQEVDLGTHTMFIAEVTDAFSTEEDSSATYAFYHKNIKPAPQPAKKKGWICTVCGYIYEGEVLPEDFICPTCKHPASDFKRIE
ncbi:flavin reductase [Prevotella sp. P5-92]|uniref:flavin reductase n=1 Tax=Prevotella sp. P5-92 TaxID=2024222 RepID=UPI000B967D4A|nr:flavin reductase [Prevotella sp. P5-92]OYP59695.1 flavin reductase [Prevotella sp. P5-92]